MRNKIWVSIWVALSLIVSPSLSLAEPGHSPAGGGKCEEKTKAIVKKCEDAKDSKNAENDEQAAGASLLASATPPGQNGAGNLQKSTLADSASRLTDASSICAKLHDECKKPCDAKKPDEKAAVDDCEKKTQAVADGLQGASKSAGDQAAASGKTADAAGAAKPQSADSGSGSGMGSALTSLLPVLAMGGMAALMMKQQQDAAAAAKSPTIIGALQANGSLDCNQYDSYTFQDCENSLKQICAGYGVATANSGPSMVTGSAVILPNAALAGTNTPDCASFNSRFCSPQVVAAQPNQIPLPGGSVAQLNMNGSGDGLGSPYCMNALASSYCGNPNYASARQQCPSCLNLQVTQSTGCATNPALCMAQNSNAQISQARATCPDDPVFSYPGSPYLQASAVQASSVSAQMPSGGTAVVLPQSVGSKGNKASVGRGGISTQSVDNGTATEPGQGGMREGQSKVVSAHGSGNGSSAGAMASSSGYMPASVGGGGRIPSGATVVQGIRTASARGPASDVQAQYGPSLFATSTQVIKQRCLAGKLNNCPRP